MGYKDKFITKLIKPLFRPFAQWETVQEKRLPAPNAKAWIGDKRVHMNNVFRVQELKWRNFVYETRKIQNFEIGEIADADTIVTVKYKVNFDD